MWHHWGVMVMASSGSSLLTVCSSVVQANNKGNTKVPFYLTFVVDSPRKRQVMRKAFPCHRETCFYLASSILSALNLHNFRCSQRRKFCQWHFRLCVDDVHGTRVSNIDETLAVFNSLRPGVAQWIGSSLILRYFTIDSGDGLAPNRHQAITWINCKVISVVVFGTDFSQILFKTCVPSQQNALVNVVCKMSAMLVLASLH